MALGYWDLKKRCVNSCLISIGTLCKYLTGIFWCCLMIRLSQWHLALMETCPVVKFICILIGYSILGTINSKKIFLQLLFLSDCIALAISLISIQQRHRLKKIDAISLVFVRKQPRLLLFSFVIVRVGGV